ncbi:DnaB-like helicase N-terminal domain-containing protein [Hamadaea sp. NPDC051192]|uniref:DnaB-like helicase N-terminal domain-containing protein n=1 Tax=Hamadaea sp. NPDC051192 TaxID=3154940 RepID=UPI003419EE83
MSYLTVRAEQALIGAMLSDDELPSIVDRLKPDDIGHNVARAIVTAIRELRAAFDGPQLVAEVALRVNVVGVDAEWLEQLVEQRPRVDHVAAYARMIKEASFKRRVTAHAEGIAAAAAAGHTTGPAVDHLGQLAQVLAEHAIAYAPFTDDHQRPDRFASSRHLTSAAASGAERATKEDLILADLLRNPELARELATLLPSESFTSEQRRNVYETIVSLAYDHEPIDEIIVAWTLAKQRTADRLYGLAIPEGAEPDTAYVARLARVDVDFGTAIAVAREIYAADVRAELTARMSSAPVVEHAIHRKAEILPAPAHDNGVNPPQIRL